MNSELNRLYYRETIQGSGAGEGKVIRRRGGVGVYANIRVAVRALKQGEGTLSFGMRNQRCRPISHQRFSREFKTF
jgi:hypothetical protein